METLLQADIFFFITAVATVVLSILVGIAVVYLIRILRNVRDISDTAKRGANALASDVEELRSNLKKNSGNFSSILSLVNFVKKRKDKRGR